MTLTDELKILDNKIKLSMIRVEKQQNISSLSSKDLLEKSLIFNW